MRAIVCTLALLIVASTATAQPLVSTPAMPLGILSGYELVGPITLTPETPGDELVFRFTVWRNLLFIVVPNAPRSGLFGQQPTPGVCLEPFVHFDVFAHTASIAIADVNGDGLDDLIATGADQVQVLMGRGLTVCR